jgi:hypothetical protein
MPKIVSVRPETLRAPIFLREPLVLGREEIVWPHGTVTFEPYVMVEVEDRHAPGIIEYFGMTGVVVLQKDETLEEAILRAKIKRVEFLTKQILRFREEQAIRSAQHLEPLMPSQSLRGLFQELGFLRKEVVTLDPLMTDALPALNEPVIADPLRAELEQFGIPIEAAPLVPKGMGAALGLEV